MKKRILIPTDFSQNAFNAIEYAMELFKEQECDFLILNSYYHSGYSKDNLLSPEPKMEVRREIQSKSEENMRKLKGRMDTFNANPLHSFFYLNEFGAFFEVMEKTVEKEGIQLVIMGTRGQTDNKTVILGSNAVNVMEKIRQCPVLAIPSTVAYKAPNEIVFPTSFRTNYKQTELKLLVEIAQITNAPIRILHIQSEKSLTEAQLSNKAMLEGLMAGAAYTHHRLYNIEVNDGVRSFVQSRESEMIAIVNKKHSFFGSIFSNPMVKELEKHTNVPLLALHDREN